MVSHVRNTWKPGGIAFVALTVSAVVLAGSPVQAADEDSSLAPAEVYAALESASEVEGIPAPLAHLDRSRALDAGEPLSITTPRAKVSLKIGGNDVPGESIGDGLLAYENLPGVATVPIGRSDGSVQVITVLEDASSPTEFTYTLEGQDGSTLRELDEGFVSLFDSSGAPVVAVAPAWAVDANGESVPTWYEVEGNELVQHVAHDSSFEYPIVADPWVGGTYLEEYSWYSGSVRVMYRPTWFASWGCFGNVACGSAWMGTAQAELVNAQSNSTLKARAGYSTTRNQIGCHMIGAGTKSPWNLETNVADIGLPAFLVAECNP